MTTSVPQVGIYYYPWYNAQRWSLHPKKYTPAIGEYDSSHPALIQNHVQQLQELGVDYVVIEMLPVNDWAFQNTYQATQRFVEALRTTSIQYTFLIDTAVGEGHKKSCAYFGKLITLLKQSDLLPTKCKDGKPLLLFFSTTVPEALKLQDDYGQSYSIFFPIFLQNWQVSDDNCNAVMRERGYDFPSGTLRSTSLVEAGFIQFWAATKDLIPCKGFSSVIPGYNDLLLNRSPQLAPIVSRANGQTLVEQFKKAVESKTDEILIYGWNEYFEETNIEPTLEYGNFYFQLTKHLISQIKAQQNLSIPAQFFTEKSISPVYLNSELVLSGKRHSDGIPRWDQDYYVAKIENIANPNIINNNLIFKKIKITNIGTKSWNIHIDSSCINVGIQLLSNTNSVLREGRANLETCVSPCQNFVVDVCLKLNRILDGIYKIKIGMVYENKFWFSSTIIDNVHIGSK